MSAAESNPSLLSLSQLWFLSPLRGWHRNPSKAFYQAFQSGSRLRDSKAHSDRYGTILDWAGWACKSVTTCVRCSAATSFAFFLFFFFFFALSPSTCMDWVWKQSLAASAGLANWLLNKFSVSVCNFSPSLCVFFDTLTVHFVPCHSNVLITGLLFPFVLPFVVLCEGLTPSSPGAIGGAL